LPKSLDRTVLESSLHVEILPQPDDTTCGPTCLHALYRYYGDDIPLERVISEVTRLEEGGTVAAMLACHALRRGYQATIYTYNLQVFDPTWFTRPNVDLAERLKLQGELKHDAKLRITTAAYLELLSRGGRLRFEDLTTALIRKYLTRGVPILTGLSATYLFRNVREYGPNDEDDDLRGLPQGHFVVLCGYDRASREVLVADPLATNPLSGTNQYCISVDRVICAILLGMVTYDANLLIIEPPKEGAPKPHADAHRRGQQGRMAL
jgi:hypothetical protein